MATLSDTDWDSRFNWIDSPTGNAVWERPEIRDAAEPIEATHLWTILDIDGDLYIVPGYHFVNSYGYVVTKEAWEALDQQNEWVWA